MSRWGSKHRRWSEEDKQTALAMHDMGAQTQQNSGGAVRGGEDGMNKRITVALAQVVASTLKLGKRSLRTIDGGDVRDVLGCFESGEQVVIMRESDFDKYVLRIK